jgi:hypothetical protein
MCTTSQTDHTGTTPTEEVADRLWKQRHEILYCCGLSVRYHRRRERFYDLLDKAVSAITLFAGSAAFVSATDPGVVQLAAALVAAVSYCALVFGFSNRARRYSELAAEYKRIESEVYQAGDYDFTERQINAWRARIAQVEVSEPMTLRALTILCQNEIAEVEKHPDMITNLLWHQRFFAHLFDFPNCGRAA